MRWQFVGKKWLGISKRVRKDVWQVLGGGREGRNVANTLS